MHRDAGPPHWKSIQTQKPENAHGLPDRQTDERMDRWTYYTATQGISPRGLRAHALRAIMGRVNDRQKPTWTGTHWVPSDPSVGINASRRWTPTLEINTNTKIIRF